MLHIAPGNVGYIESTALYSILLVNIYNKKMIHETAVFWGICLLLSEQSSEALRRINAYNGHQYRLFLYLL